MEDKKKSYKLDEIGFIGTQERKSTLKKKREYQLTATLIRNNKEAKVKRK